MKTIEKRTNGIRFNKNGFKNAEIIMRATYTKGFGSISFQFNNNEIIHLPADEILNILSEAKKANE